MKPTQNSDSKSPIFINVAPGAKEWLLARPYDELQVAGALLTIIFLSAHAAGGWSPDGLFTGDGDLKQLNLKEFSFSDEDAHGLATALTAKGLGAAPDKSKDLAYIQSVIRFFERGAFRLEQSSRAGPTEKRSGKGFAGLSSLATDGSPSEEENAADIPRVNSIAAPRVAAESTGNSLVVEEADSRAIPVQPNKSTYLVLGGMFILIVVFLVFANMPSGSGGAKAPVNRDAAATAPVPQKILVAVAAASANIREKPTAQSRQLKIAHIGDPLEFVSVADTFTQIRLADSTVGYIASELIVPINDFERLKNLSADQYLAQNAPEKRMEELFTKLQPMRELFLAAIGAVALRSTDIKTDLQNLENQPRLDMTLDASAGVLYSLAARSLANAGKKDEAFLSARAAVVANPAAVDYHVAYALLGYQIGFHDAVKGAANILPVLAPKTTNAWMIFGLSIAMDDPDQLDSAAVGSFVLALKLSKNPPATRKYFNDLIKKTDKPRVQRLLAEALAEEAANPGIFGL